MQNEAHTQPHPAIYARSVLDTAQALGLSRSKIYELIAARTILAYKVGKRTLVPETEIQRFHSDRMGAAA